MGMSLPLLAKAASLGDRPPEEWIGALYGVNTVGAAAGSLVTVWFLAPALGFFPKDEYRVPQSSPEYR
jgi:hypothetical protein